MQTDTKIEVETKEILLAIGQTICTYYDAIYARDQNEAKRMINSLIKWLNDEAMWDETKKQLKNVS